MEHYTSSVAICLLLNAFFSISIVLLNKAIYSVINFPPITLTLVHFVFTTVGVLSAWSVGVFQAKKLPLSRMIPISLSLCGFVVLTNLSLKFNTVGTYQVIKVLTMPTVIIIQTFIYKRTFSTQVKLSVIPVVLGAIITSVFDIAFNVTGVVVGVAGTVVTSFYQVLVNEEQKNLDCNSLQLLLYQAPLSSVAVACAVPFLEPVFAKGGVFASEWSSKEIMLISSSGVVAFGVNVTIFWIIGNTSALSYNMLGHFKFCLTLAGGFLIFRDTFNLLQFVGIICTFLGIVAYSHVKLQEEKTALKSFDYTPDEVAVNKSPAEIVNGGCPSNGSSSKIEVVHSEA